MDQEAANTLLEEHLALGALLDEGTDGRLAPLRYNGVDEKAAFSEGVALVDLTCMGSQLVSGDDTSAFISALFAGEELAIGQCAPQVALTGDGSLSSLVLLARTGQEEFAWWDLVGRDAIMSCWADFVISIEQGGIQPFGEVELEDASEALVPILLWGPQAGVVLSDYLGDQDLPAPGTIANRMLDKINCLVAVPAFDDQPCYLVLVPPARARVLWRSFLSFNEVSPVGLEAFRQQVQSCFDVLGNISGTFGCVTPSREQLLSAGLLRADGSFIGARGLS